MIKFKDLTEAHSIGDRVIIKHGSADIKGKEGRIGEIRKGAFTGAPKTFTVDYDHNEKTGSKKSVQLKSNHFTKISEETVLESDAAWAAAKEKEKENKLTTKDNSTVYKIQQMMNKEKKKVQTESMTNAQERGAADKHYGRKYNNPHDKGSQEHSDYHKGYHTTDSEKDYGTSKGKPLHKFESTFTESALERFRKASAEREKEANKREAEMKARHAAGKEDMKGAINTLATRFNKEDVDYKDAIQMLDEALSSIDKGEYDYEGAMARTQLQTTIRNSQELIDMLSMDDNMPEWVQSKITLAQDYISSVRDYLKSREELGESASLEEGTFKYHMDKAISAHDRGDTKRKEFHLANAKQASYSLKSTDIPKHKDLLDKYKSMTESRGSAAKHWDIAQGHKEQATLAKGNKEQYHTHMAKHHDSMANYHSEMDQPSLAQAHSDKADIHHEKSLEQNEAVDLRAQLQKHSAAAIAANKAGDDEKVKHHMNKMNAIKDKMAKAVSEEAPANNVGSGNIAGTQGDAGVKAVMTKAPLKRKLKFEEFSNLLDDCICETADAGLAAKAAKSGISIGTLRKVYRRGVAAWNSGHRPGTTPQQWGMARVNSYITKGKGTYHGADKDLREETNAVKSLESSLNKPTGYDAIDQMMTAIAKDHSISPKQLHIDFVKKHGKTPDEYAKGMTEGSSPESFKAGYDRRVIKTTKPEHKDAGYNWRIKGKERPEISIKLYKDKPSQEEFNAQMRRVAGHEFGESTIAEDSRLSNDAYHKGVSDSTAKSRVSHWKKMDKLSDKNPAAYEPAPGDATAKTKLSKHTIKYRQMFGEDMDEELYEACWDTHKQIGMKKKGNRMVPNCVPKNESVEDQFDMIEEVIEELASIHGVDSDEIWQDLETIDDDELLEYAIDAKGHKSSTGGLTQKGVDAYNAKTGGNLQTAVTTKPSKLKPGSKAANRRKSFCARMGGMKKRLTSAKTANDPDSRINKALRKWNC